MTDPREFVKGVVVFVGVALLVVVLLIIIGEAKKSLPTDSPAQESLSNLEKPITGLVDLFTPDPLEILLWALGLLLTAAAGVGIYIWHRDNNR